ncbi:hypothetical protein BT63DRAFT_421494 [Microthyrium microscopicum]|uniref:non-specific serine/threonine protein kinase n=1 Tax=Microthyrium microscopicum TaxID=703497 RepID=A0A6A6UM29_9PEZI|nr:hypothetical protein BT63DRAFT_421494 [Microthyrium microscopicum]
MAPQKKGYGKRRRPEPVFRLTPLLQSSPRKAPAEPNIDDLTLQLEKIQIEQDDSILTRSRRKKLLESQEMPPTMAPTPTRSRSPIKTRTQEPLEVDDLAALVTSLAIESSPSREAQIKPQSEIDTIPDLSESSISQTSSTISLVEPLDPYTAPLLSLSSDPVNRINPTPFSDWSSSLEPHFNIIKIAEASYGEVYRLKLKARHPLFTVSDESVLKVLALKPPPTNRKKTKAQQNKEDFMSAVDNVAAEVKLLQRMADIPSFTNFRDVRVLRGRPSPVFAKAWAAFNEEREEEDKSVFPDPSKKTAYSPDQLWAVIEMQDAGKDLEHICLKNVFAVWDVFWGVTLALAKGEQEAEFEHRDLHMGNICVKPRKEDDEIGAENARVRNVHGKLGFTGLEPTLIDYTLSRAETFGRDERGRTVPLVEFLDLTTEGALFEADATYEYQYEVYRYMRSAMYFSDALAEYNEDDAAESGRTWAGFHPQTNLVWLHFILHKMLETVVWPSKSMPKTLQFLEVRGKQEDKEARAKAKELEAALKKLRKMLDPRHISGEDLGSAADLVSIALDSEWLDMEDIVGDGDDSLSSLLERS